jgi:hypothetical protein
MSELLILWEIMARIQYKLKLDSMPLPCDYFQLIGGSGTGGFVAVVLQSYAPSYIPLVSRLVAIMLGRLRMSIDDAIKYYDSLTKRVFSEGKKTMGDGKFKATALEDVIKEIVKARTGDADSHMMDMGSEGQVCKTYVTAPPLRIASQSC